jgi:hypothetical protein
MVRLYVPGVRVVAQVGHTCDLNNPVESQQSLQRSSTMATINLTIGGDPKALLLIEEGNYSSEYLLKESTAEYRLKIRHSKEKAPPGGVAMDRHNVDLTVRTYPTALLPNGSTDNAYVVIRSNPNSDGSVAVDIAGVLAEVLTTYAAALVAWAPTLE